jgi:sugar phosphate isomerase/epimerase
MNILFSTGSLPHLPIEETFALVKEAGFSGCELVIDKSFEEPRYEERVRECLTILPVHSIHAPYTSIPSWGDEIQALTRTIDLARELRAKVITFHPPSWLAREFRYYLWFRKVRDFQKELKTEGIFLAIENMPRIKLILPPYFLNHFRRLIRLGMQRNLYFTLDITHMGTYGFDTVAAFLIFFKSGRLRNIHLSDYSLWRDKGHLGIGRGELPIVRLLNTVRSLGYEGNITLEVAPHELPRTREWLLRVITYGASFLKLHLDRNYPVDSSGAGHGP